MKGIVNKITWKVRVVKDRKNKGFFKFNLKLKPKRLYPKQTPVGRMDMPLPGDCFENDGESIPMYFMNNQGLLEKIQDKRVNCPCGSIENPGKKKDKFVPLDKNS